MRTKPAETHIAWVCVANDFWFLTYEEIANYTQKGTRAVLVAGGKGEPALDVNGGIFTTAFLDGLRGEADFAHNGVITIDQLAVYIQQKVTDRAHLIRREQNPQLDRVPGYGEGKFVFIDNKRAGPS